MAEFRTGHAIALVVDNSLEDTWTQLTGEPEGQLGMEVSAVLYASGSYGTGWTLHTGDQYYSGSIGGTFASGSNDGHVRADKYHLPPLAPNSLTVHGRYTSPASGSYCALVDGAGTMFHVQYSEGTNHAEGGATITELDPPIVATYPIRYWDSDDHNRIIVFGKVL